jgi:hypothetical protein
MKNSINLGIHVYEQNKSLDWEEELIFFNLLSCLSWINFEGPIQLYTNQRYLDTLKRYGVDTLYQTINTKVLENKSNEIDYTQYWAFSKLIVLEHLKEENNFTLVDTDFWFLNKVDIPKNCDVVVYHREEFDNNYHQNPYPDFDFMLPESVREMNFDKTVLPTNTAFLRFNSNSFVDEWINLCKAIANYAIDKSVPNGHKSTKMCFVEQRLLPMLLKKRGLTYKPLINNVYRSHFIEPQDGSEWYPRLENTPQEDLRKFLSIKHVWGLKNFFDREDLRKMVMKVCLSNFNRQDFIGKPYQKLYDSIYLKYN